MAAADAMTDAAHHREAVAIAPGVHWIGALDPALRTFDIILRTEQGTTYNAYLVRGRDGVAVIDTVKAEFAEEFFARLESVADYGEIRAIVLNHLEPDHSGALPELLRRAPQATLYISARAPAILNGLLKSVVPRPKPPLVTVKTGDSLSLGERKLRFLLTPFVHWPDTQCTYLADEGVLFCGDLFGCHLCDGRLFDDRIGEFWPAIDYYYAHIMRPFAHQVREALAEILPLEPRVLAPTHGPILRERPRRYLEHYQALARRPANGPPRLAIFYISAYGNTAQMAEAIAAGAGEADGVQVSTHDIETGETAAFLDLIEGADAVAFGSPTINGDAVKPIWDLLSSLATIDVKGKRAGAFGSYGWSGEAIWLIEERLRGLKMQLPVPGLRIKLIPSTEEIAACHAFGRQLADSLVGGPGSARTLDLAEIG
ncbi:FprA family A-type flavoprotein [Thiococcus pfennigii]|jgi:flavorubredoxin|uniref:FprA family A-type flavoprotein n=1 Tax=Thiococcus pfennigii TaxID=1057 RepID=UPI001902F797|nr:FprA family A-type flavoprotein [Thiococcus pfennigii]MBK1701244.1 MBL fold metallo-hydrolase [Thiococcus pfennigii]